MEQPSTTITVTCFPMAYYDVRWGMWYPVIQIIDDTLHYRCETTVPWLLFGDMNHTISVAWIFALEELQARKAALEQAVDRLKMNLEAYQRGELPDFEYPELGSIS